MFSFFTFFFPNILTVFGLLFNIHSTQGRCRSWASAVSLEFFSMGPENVQVPQAVWASWSLGSSPSQASSVEELASRGPWPQAPATHVCLSPAWASCPPHGQSLSPSILAPAQIRGLLLVSGSWQHQLLFWQDIPVRPAHHTPTSDIWALS